jgi:hypothetical protein
VQRGWMGVVVALVAVLSAPMAARAQSGVRVALAWDQPVTTGFTHVVIERKVGADPWLQVTALPGTVLTMAWTVSAESELGKIHCHRVYNSLAGTPPLRSVATPELCFLVEAPVVPPPPPVPGTVPVPQHFRRIP